MGGSFHPEWWQFISGMGGRFDADFAFNDAGIFLANNYNTINFIRDLYFQCLIRDIIINKKLLRDSFGYLLIRIDNKYFSLINNIIRFIDDDYFYDKQMDYNYIANYSKESYHNDKYEEDDILAIKQIISGGLFNSISIYNEYYLSLRDKIINLCKSDDLPIHNYWCNLTLTSISKTNEIDNILFYSKHARATSRTCPLCELASFIYSIMNDMPINKTIEYYNNYKILENININNPENYESALKSLSLDILLYIRLLKEKDYNNARKILDQLKNNKIYNENKNLFGDIDSYLKSDNDVIINELEESIRILNSRLFAFNNSSKDDSFTHFKIFESMLIDQIDEIIEYYKVNIENKNRLQEVILDYWKKLPPWKLLNEELKSDFKKVIEIVELIKIKVDENEFTASK